MIRLWTIQPASVWDQIQAQGIAYAHEPRSKEEAIEPYEWLRKRLGSRLTGYTGRLPWWFYCQKPDLRRHRRAGHVRIEVLVPRERVCVLRCWAWDLVRTQSYLPLTAAEQRDWRRAMRRVNPEGDIYPLPEPWQQRLEATWERVFSPSLSVGQPAYIDGFCGTRGWSECEAVMECLRRSDVVRVDSIRGKPAWVRPRVLITSGRLKRLRVLAKRLHVAADPVSQYVASRFASRTRSLLAEYQHNRSVWRALRSVLATELNRIVEGDSIHEVNRFARVRQDADLQGILRWWQTTGGGAALLNYSLLSAAYPRTFR